MKTTVRLPLRGGDTKAETSVALGLVATGCALATVASTVFWLGTVALSVALVGFLIGYTAGGGREATFGQLLNLIALIMLTLWAFAVVAQAVS